MTFGVFARAEVGYDLLPGIPAFPALLLYSYGVRGRYYKADSDTYEAVVGTTFDLTNLLTGEVFIGYLTRDYDEEFLEDFTGLAFGLSLDYAITQLTSLGANVSRAVEETGTNPSPRERSTFRVGIDHELLRNVTLSALAEYRMDDYQNTDQEDDFYLVQASATYNINRNFYLRGTYSYTTRDSNQPGDDYDRNLFLLRVGAQL